MHDPSVFGRFGLGLRPPHYQDFLDRELQVDFVEANPPNSWTLSDYGKTFIDTLEDVYPDDREVAGQMLAEWLLDGLVRQVGPARP